MTGPATTRGGAPAQRVQPRSARAVATAVGFAVLAVALSAERAAAQAANGEPEIRYLRLTDWRGELEATARLREHNQRSRVTTEDTRSKENIFEESIKLTLDGYAYHPNLLDFTASSRFGLTQQEFEEVYNGRRQHSADDGPLLEFEFIGHVLKDKTYPGTITARQSRELEPRPFQASLETTATNYAVVWQYVSERIPTSFQFSHTDVQLDSLDPAEADGQQTNTLYRFETGYRFSDHNVFSFLYEHEKHEEQPFELNYDSDELTLGHRLDFGAQHAQRLDSELNYFDQRGTFDIERLRWRETLRLIHAENLRSWYLFEWLDRTQGTLSDVAPVEEQSLFLSGTVEHQLYESLTSQLTGFYQKQEFGQGLDIDRYGTQLNFDYRKTNPAGVFLVTYGYRWQAETREGAGRGFEVTDEQRTFNDPEPIVLVQQNVERGSLFITADDRTTVFLEGRDYRVEVYEDRLEIHRVPTGRIADGTTVLIDYTFQLGGDFDLTTTTHNLSVRQRFSFGVTPYYRLRVQEQDLTPPDATGITPNDVTAQIIGVEYREDPWRLSAEYEDHDSTISPFEAVRLTADYTQRWKIGASLSLKARWTDMTYTEPNDRETEFLSLEGLYRHTLTDQLAVEAGVIYRQVDDTLSGDDQGVDVDLSLEWAYRQTEVRVTYEYSQFEDDFAQSDSQMLYVQFVRHF